MDAVRRGETPTIEGAAEAAGVSRATAYRYFESQQSLLLETSLEEFSAPAADSAVRDGPVEVRVDAAIRTLLSMYSQHETYVRTFLLSTQERWLNARKECRDAYPLRKGRRLKWLEVALEPLGSLPSRQKRRLMVGLAMLCGIESLIVAKDVCNCTTKEAEETCAWAAQAILRAALDCAQTGGGELEKRGAAKGSVGTRPHSDKRRDRNG